MTYARKLQVSLADTTYYHVIGRCVRRAWLWGVDEYADRDLLLSVVSLMLPVMGARTFAKRARDWTIHRSFWPGTEERHSLRSSVF